MNLNCNFVSLTEFNSNPSKFVNQSKETGEPIVLTINGKAALVVQDFKTYQRLFNIAERLKTTQAVKEGIAAIDRGEGHSMDNVFDALERELR